MCEFNVIKENKIVFKEAVYAKADGNEVVVKDILGSLKKFGNSAIVEVDVTNTRLVLSTI